MQVRMNRKEFIQRTTILSAASLFLPGCISRLPRDKESLKGFIVSDSHFGWDSPVQPRPARQRKMMEIILKRFPDLDMFIDTGDAHHNDRNNLDPVKSRQDWVDIIQAGCRQVPFYYLAGNHDIDTCYGKDPEADCNFLGSVSCRPYYSWDMKGVHFVAIPELVRTVFVNNEILEWVTLDLELNKDKTTILLSHNQLLETTSGHEPGYRGLLNTDQIWTLLRKYPNVKAWMHGHNHNYEMVEKDGVLFISNGRIGGFDPAHGAQGLGGIYFEVTSSGFIAKSYSAEKDKFLTRDDVNDKMLVQYYPGRKLRPDAKLDFRTSLDVRALPSYAYGMGGANSETVAYAAHHHAVQKGKSTLFIGNSENSALNDDPDFAYFIRSGRHGDKNKKTSYMGGNIKGHYDWVDPNGVKLLQAEEGSLPVIQFPGRNFGKYCYYKVGPGTSYVASVKFSGVTGGQTAQMHCKVCDVAGNEIDQMKSDLWVLEEGDSERTFEVQLPENRDTRTRTNGNGPKEQLHMSFALYVDTRDGDVIVKRVSIDPKDRKGSTKNPTVNFDGKEWQHTGILESYVSYNIPNPQGAYSACSVHAEGSKRLTWLVKHEGWDWQVRNAAVKDNGDSLEFDGLRNPYTHKKEVVFVPSTRLKEPYVYKMRNAMKAKVFPINRGNRKLHFVVEEVADGELFAEIEVMNSRNNKVKGAEVIESGDDKSIVRVQRGENVYIG